MRHCRRCVLDTGARNPGLIYLSHLNIPTRDRFILPTTLASSGIHLREPERVEQTLREHLRILEEDIARRDGEVKRFGDPGGRSFLPCGVGRYFLCLAC